MPGESFLEPKWSSSAYELAGVLKKSMNGSKFLDVLVSSLAERKIRSYMGRQPHSLSKAEALEMAGAFAAMAMGRGQGLMPPRDIQEAMKTYIIAVLHE